MNRSSIESARERHFEALVEECQGAEVPVAEILEKAAQPEVDCAVAPPTSRTPRWLAAALVLLGLGVAVAVLALQLREPGSVDRPAQDPALGNDRSWVPADVLQVTRPGGFDRDDASVASAVHLAFPLYTLRSLKAFPQLEHLSVELWPATMAELIKRGHWGEDGVRLRPLVGAGRLRTLTLDGQPLAIEDLAALAEVPSLEAVRFRGITIPGDEQALCRVFDAAFTGALAAHCTARSLMLEFGAIEPGALRALAPMGLQELVISAQQSLSPETLLEIGELETLERLELRLIHGVGIEGTIHVGGRPQGQPALTPRLFEVLGQLPNLRVLALEQCALDDDLVRALPRGLEHLDLASCSGMRSEVLGAVLADMERLRGLGLPLPLDDAPGDRESFRIAPPWREGEDLHQPTSEEVCAWIDSRPWRSLRLYGAIQQPLVDVIVRQTGLVELELSPAASSQSLAFLQQLPGVRRVAIADLRLRSRDAVEALVSQLEVLRGLERVDFIDFETVADRVDVAERLGPDSTVRFWMRR